MDTKIKHIYFAGICGTAMASLAVLLKKRGYHITGSDQNVYPPMSTFLAENQIPILEGYEESHLTPQPDLVVIGNALSRGNAEVEVILERQIPFISMAELLKEYFIRGRTSLVVTGTHGKTTTTSLLAWVFEDAGKSPGFMIGGIIENFGTSCRDGAGDFFITEGDEYDTAFFDKRSKFFHYLPNQLIINNIEFDHADIFDSLENILQAFRFLLRLVPRNGLIVVNGDDENAMSVIQHAHSPYVTFGLGENCTVQATDLRPTENGTSFHFEWPEKCSQVFHIPLLGSYNVRNAMGVIILALHNGIQPHQIQTAFDGFSGVKRRLELRGEERGVKVYDDFAHHPTAVRETIEALRQKYPQNRIFAVFEPRSNTSVLNINQKLLETAFDSADEAILTYPFRMQRIAEEKRLDINAVVKALIKGGKSAYGFESVTQIINHLVEQVREGDNILIMSNGKFDNIHQRLLERLKTA